MKEMAGGLPEVALYYYDNDTATLVEAASG